MRGASWSPGVGIEVLASSGRWLRLRNVDEGLRRDGDDSARACSGRSIGAVSLLVVAVAGHIVVACSPRVGKSSSAWGEISVVVRRHGELGYGLDSWHLYGECSLEKPTARVGGVWIGRCLALLHRDRQRMILQR